jgi:hypothetical protein
MPKNRMIETRRGSIQFPAYIPVTTFGEKYPLDRLIRPYLPRLSQAVMVSFYYAKQIQEHDRIRLPMLVDSGGFASLFQNAFVQKHGELGIIRIERDDGVETIHPNDVLELQGRLLKLLSLWISQSHPAWIRRKHTSVWI